MISQETYNRAIKQCSSVLPAVQSTHKKYNEELERAKSLTTAAATPAEQYKQRLAEVERLYKSGKVNGETYTRTVRNLSKEFNQGSHAVSTYGKNIASVGRSIRNFAAIATIAITVPVAGMVKSFASFDDAMTQSTAIMGNMSAGMRAEMERTARTLSLSTKTGATELGEAYYFLASAGMNAKQSIMALPVVEKFATAGAFDMAQATDLLTDAQSALGLSSKDAKKNMQGMLAVSDTLVEANTLANASVQQFSEALTNEAGAAIKQYNIDLNEGVGILAAYADQGIKGQVAGSMFGRMVRLLIKSANDNRDAFEAMNIPIEEFSRTGKNITSVIEGITKATKELGPAEKAAALETLGFQARIQQAILPLLGMTEAIKYYDERLQEMEGTTKEVAEKQLKSFSSQMKILKNNITDLGIEIGKILAPYIKKVGDLIKEMLEYWRGLGDGMKNIIAIIVGVAAALAPVLTVIGAIMIAIGGLVSVIGMAFAPGVFATFVAALGTTLPVILAVTAAMVALGVATKSVLDLNRDLNKISGEKKKQEALSAITKEMQELVALQKEQESIVIRQTQLKDAGKWYDPDELKQASSNIEIITESIKELNAQSQNIMKGQTGGGIKRQTEQIDKQIDALIEQRDIYGKTSAELVEYDLKLKGATETEISFAKAIAEEIDALEKAAAATERRKETIQSLKEETALLGLSEKAAFLYKLQIDGASQAELRLAEAVYEGYMVRKDAVEQAGKQAEAEKALTKDVDSLISALLVQYDTYGMTSNQIAVYNLELRGAEEGEILAAKAIIKKINALEKQQKLIDEGRQLTEGMRTETEKLADSLEYLKAIYAAGGFDSKEIYDTAVTEMADKNITETPSIGINTDSEFGRFDAQKKELNAWYDEQIEMLQEFRNSRSDMMETWDAKEEQLTQQHANALSAIETARHRYTVESAASSFGQMADLMAEYGGKQTILYKVLFAASKSFTIAEAMLNMQQAISEAGTQPFPANLAAIAKVGAEMARIVSSVMAIGMADDGVQNIPESGSWYLKKGERITTENTSAKLDRTLDDIQNDRNAVIAPMNVNIYEAPGTSAQVTQRSDGGVDIQIELIENQMAQRINRGAGLAKYLDNRYGRRY
jgi:TP901 family phage tail tape measure protein